ncbi:MAG: hypothetical protein IJV96_02295 [Clostridia bacterium]|nr:hypothetical protein [Clostridia bacterium]
MENKSLFEQLEQINENQQKILEAINQGDTDSVKTTVSQRNRAFVLKNFIQRSIHEYMWFGTKEGFGKDKKLALILILSSIVSMIICTIVASVSFGLYSTFTLFENIWLFLMLFVLKYTCKTKKNYSDLEYSFDSFERFVPDADGVWRCTTYKKKYVWFFVLACIAFLSNVIFAWLDDHSTPLLVTILELGTLALNLFTVYKVTDFFAGYGPIRFSGMNEEGTARVVLIFDTAINKLYTEEDYLETFPFMK